MGVTHINETVEIQNLILIANLSEIRLVRSFAKILLAINFILLVLNIYVFGNSNAQVFIDFAVHYQTQ